MLNLTKQDLAEKIRFMDRYAKAANAASASVFDANANISSKNIATLEHELSKDLHILLNRQLMKERLSELFGEECATEYIRQLESHEVYVHDETSMKPYCISASLYPFLLKGMRCLGGESGPPKHLDSFCGSFVNLVFALSSQFAGAVATVEFLTYFDYFARKDLGEGYLTSHAELICNRFQQIVYSINQPAAARGYQAVFWNISIFDQYYFEEIFRDFVFPDHVRPQWSAVAALQKFFLSWLNLERQRAVLTFPVVTAAMLVGDAGPEDTATAEMLAEELASGNSFFIYQSRSVDSLASCCRLRNELAENTFSYSLGAGGVATGSIKVITMNLNRLVQDGRSIVEEAAKVRRYLVAYRSLIEAHYEQGLLPVYHAGFISLKKQFLTLGVNGLLEAAEALGYQPGVNDAYIEFVRSTLQSISDGNRIALSEYGFRFNTELVPAENLGIKNANWDRKDGYQVSRSVYNSYLYPVEEEGINTLDKLLLHGGSIAASLDGGAAVHLNLEEYLTSKQYLALFRAAATVGCNYFCTNVKISICNQCGQIDKRTLKSCSACGSDDIDHATRIIGYLKRVSSFSGARQKEEALRYYHRA